MNRLLTSCVCTVYSKDIHVVTDTEHEDSFFVLVNHDNIEKDIIARIYAYRNSWYIWYRKKCYRQKVGSFSEALLILEEEVLKCVA